MRALLLGAAALGGVWAAATARGQLRRAEIARRQLAALTDAVGSLARAAALDDLLAGVLRAIGGQLDARWGEESSQISQCVSHKPPRLLRDCIMQPFSDLMVSNIRREYSQDGC